MIFSSRPLPPQYVSLQLLARSEESEVHHARGPEGEVALRLSAPWAGAPGRSELGVLAAVDHPGLARLIDFGRVAESGDTWVARSWIEGVDLRTWVASHSAEELGGLLAKLCPALQHLHDRGFVHADVKPENVLVDAQGEPYLTDFGLSLCGTREGMVAGSLFYIAPEVLGGGSPERASDLFALGVMLHALLLAPEVGAAPFYSRFPREDFFTASATKVSQLPDWARGVVAELLERDPARRPPSARAVGSALRARLGLTPSKDVVDLRRHEVRWSHLEGRQEWLASLGTEQQSSGLFRLPAGDDSGEFTAALRLWMSLRGEAASIFDPSGDGADVEDLNEVAREALEGASDGVLLVPLASTDHDAWRRFDFLLRYARQKRPGPEAPRIFGVSDREPSPGCPVQAIWEVPELNLRDLVGLLRRELAGEVEPLAAQLHAASGGALGEALRRLQRGFARGDFVEGVDGPALRPGARPEHWTDEPSLFDATPPPLRAELELLAALEVCSGRAELDELRELVRAREEPFTSALCRQLEAGTLRFSRNEQRRASIVLTRPLEERVFEELGLARAQELYARRAEDLEQKGEAPLRVSLARYAAKPCAEGLSEVLEGLQKLTEAWRQELSLNAAEELERLTRRFAPEHRPRAAAEVAIAWARLGQLDRAERRLAALEDQGAANDSTLATIERARGVIAHERHDFDRAAEHLERARELHRDDGGESLFRQVMLAWDRRAEEEVDQLCATAEHEAEGMRNAFRWNVDALRGLSLCRRGRFEEGIDLLEGQLEEAVDREDRAREAKALLNMATVLRWSGNTERAAQYLRRAARIQEEENHLPGLAQARALLGGTLRAEGRLHEAEQLLRSAYELRDRLGDDSGATAARGMLGLAYADRGHLRTAIDELEASARQLRGARRSADAVLLEARALELEARITAAAPKARSSTAPPAADPRVLLSHARAEALWGQEARATDYARRALELSLNLGLDAKRVEACFLLESLTGESPDQGDATSLPTRVAAEIQAWRFTKQTADEFEQEAVLEAARSLASRGFVDLAARLAMVVLARTESDEGANSALAMARDWQEEVELGLTEEQARRARRTLLGLPDPNPRDIEAFERALEEGGVLDMDIISLLDINHRLVSQDDLTSLLGEIVESALTVTRAERGFLVLEHDGQIEFDTARHSRRGDIVDPELEVSSSVLQQVFESGKTLRLSNAGDDPLLSGAPSVENLDLRSILVTPFSVDEELRGAIYVDHRLKSGAFSARAEQMLELLSSQAALAIRQVRRLEEIRDLNGELNRRVRNREAQLAQARRALEEVGANLPVADLVGSSREMQRVHAMIDRAAPSQLPVLLCGASGTGKELAAKALHNLSGRSEGPFVAENCAALPASLIESELFGYKKGAFTGADRDRSGIFERADGGTLFLDEIGELPLELQAKLLRVLETGELRRVGGSDLIRTDFRLVAATNRDLQTEVAENRFRADLMYRLDALRIEMPALARRVEDIPELVGHFLRREQESSDVKREVSRSVLAALSRREWPGNVRELANEVARLCVLSEGDLVDPELIRAPAIGASGPSRGGFAGGTGVVRIADLERQAIEHALRETNGDKRKAATLLGISRAKLYQRLKDWAGDGAPS